MRHVIEERVHGSTLLGLLLLSAAAGCTDVGDSSATPGLDAGGLSDATVLVDGAEDSAAQTDGASGSMDATGVSPGSADAGDMGPEPDDTGTPPATMESGASGGGVDSGPDATPDSGADAADEGAPDTGAPDGTGGATTCPPASGDPSLTQICGTAPSQYCANVSSDANNCGVGAAGCGHVCPAGDAGSVASCNAGVCGTMAAPPTVCTTAPCTASQVTCSNNAASTDGHCTQTEADFVQIDITAGADVAGDATQNADSCYSCLVNAECLDNGTHFSGRECEDFGAGTYANASATVNAAATCDAVVSCVISSHCGATDNSFCYCGAGGGPSSQCVTTAGGSAANGPCITQEVAGLPDVKTDTSDNVGTFYGTKADPSGRANDIFACALSAGCTTCL